MRLKYTVFLMLMFASANVFADVGDLVVSNEFPSNKLMQENHVYKNAAVFENTGVYEGTVYAIAEYANLQLNCSPGYYLPHNSEECVICPADSYCPGGNYTFDENNDAGIYPCPDGLVSPVGTTISDNCGKILHVGEDVLYLTQTKQTHPALAVKVDGKIYYAKTAPISSGVKPMNENTTHSLHTVVEGVEYSIYDNTIPEE